MQGFLRELFGTLLPGQDGDSRPRRWSFPRPVPNTQFGNNPELRRRSGGLTVRLHEDDAKARGLTDGQRVRVGNDRGAFEAVLKITDQVRPGVAATSKGHWAKLAGGANANAVVDERDTDLGGGPVFHDTRVEISGPP
ncbi:molybdopterin dinucleotide binding domain-containing protein [Spirillospora sp. CA-128828]|uniref:molybdopterin dinucleotide binding domain-containing protein n=1 Tax=Spirillospora sp. CA-128828 TaxID=3240033 RepID=UPI003D89C2A9